MGKKNPSNTRKPHATSAPVSVQSDAWGHSIDTVELVRRYLEWYARCTNIRPNTERNPGVALSSRSRWCARECPLARQEVLGVVCARRAAARRGWPGPCTSGRAARLRALRDRAATERYCRTLREGWAQTPPASGVTRDPDETDSVGGSRYAMGHEAMQLEVHHVRGSGNGNGAGRHRRLGTCPTADDANANTV